MSRPLIEVLSLTAWTVPIFFLNFLFYIEIQFIINNVVLFSGVEQVMKLYIYLFIFSNSFPIQIVRECWAESSKSFTWLTIFNPPRGPGALYYYPPHFTDGRQLLSFIP